MNKDKIIKDLKERNDKLLEQYRYRDIRCITLERSLEQLQQKLNQKNKIIEEIKESCRSVIGNPENTIVSKNKLMKILLKEIEELEKGSEE